MIPFDLFNLNAKIANFDNFCGAIREILKLIKSNMKCFQLSFFFMVYYYPYKLLWLGTLKNSKGVRVFYTCQYVDFIKEKITLILYTELNEYFID